MDRIVEKKIPYAVKEYVKVPYDRPYPVPVEKIVEKFVKVPTPYPVERKVRNRNIWTIESSEKLKLSKAFRKL